MAMHQAEFWITWWLGSTLNFLQKMIHEIGKDNSIFNQFLAEARNEELHMDSARFRNNIERMGEILAYELSKELDYTTEEIITPLGSSDMRVLKSQPVLATILRAGLPLHQGMLNYFNKAESAFISAYRKPLKNQDKFEVEIEYLSAPELDDKELIIADPMLATGTSMALVHKALMAKGKPNHNHIVAVLATKEGINYVRKNLPKNTTFWIGAIDDELTAQSYIVPGLGDAGDISFGKK